MHSQPASRPKAILQAAARCLLLGILEMTVNNLKHKNYVAF